MGRLWGDFGVTFGALWGHFGSGGGALVNFNENPQRFLLSTRGPGTKSRGARRHRGGTKEAPRRHRGGTREAPRRHQVGNCTSTWALGHTLFKEENYRTSNDRSICFDLTRSGHKARRIFYYFSEKIHYFSNLHVYSDSLSVIVVTTM